mmetsp:Transcript_35595/g.46841  ORF Transcript_35595/g.46841 Transcript_35595/m.46841 type:complete len:87 (-) Transcript_35595:1261-1521(-)
MKKLSQTDSPKAAAASMSSPLSTTLDSDTDYAEVASKWEKRAAAPTAAAEERPQHQRRDYSRVAHNHDDEENLKQLRQVHPASYEE